MYKNVDFIYAIIEKYKDNYNRNPTMKDIYITVYFIEKKLEQMGRSPFLEENS